MCVRMYVQVHVPVYMPVEARGEHLLSCFVVLCLIALGDVFH